MKSFLARLRRFCRSPRFDAVVLGVLAVVLLLRYPLNLALNSPEPFLMDFNVYRQVALRVLSGGAAQLYAPTTDSAMMVFKYAPIWAVAWIPLGWCSIYHGAVLWTTVSVLALLATLAVSLQLCRWARLRASPLAAAAAVALLTRPLAEEMGNGQTNALWGLLTVAGIAAAARRRPWLAASAFAASMLLKLPSLLFLAYFLLRRHWGLLGRTILCLVAGTLAGSWLLLPQHPLRLPVDWALALAQNGTAYAFEIGNQSLLALLGRFLTQDAYGLNVLSLPRAVLPWILIALLAASLLIAARPMERAGGEPDGRRWLYDSALLMTMMILFSPTGWIATYLVLAWPLVLSLTALRPAPPERIDRQSAGLTGLAALCSLFQLRWAWRLVGLTAWRGERYLFLVFMTLPWMALLLIAALWRRRSFDAPRSLRTVPSEAEGRRVSAR